MADLLHFFGELVPYVPITLQVTGFSAAIGLVVALGAGMGMLAQVRLVRWCARAYVEFFRGTSALVQLFWAYFALPLFNVQLSPFTAAGVVLGLNVGAYGAEVVRGAVTALPAGQTEAALTLGLTSWQKWRFVILPQAALAMLPPAGNLLVELLKGTALVSLVAVTELTFRAHELQTATGNTAGVYTALLIIYFLLSYMITLAVRVGERRLGRFRSTARNSDVLVRSQV
ncbi:ectoine/hydroxyectoine ABC transporter permease subunit EhuC [Amycolatopsis thermoflava]|uniref:ectoine/hydroxyectoine ABC transporter permease subunit EhuC n=1 Tax=Amycolatopsis thermoflava TaxID=84480 RepID=UPI003EB80C91